MKTKTIDCVECGEKVSYGRLSCPACGALLASVAGGPARPVLEVAAADAASADQATAVDPGEAAPEVEVAPDQIALPLGAADDAAAAVDADDAPLAADRAEDAAPEVDADAADPAERELVPAAFSLSPEPIAALPAAVRTPFDGPEPILVARPYVHRVDVAADLASGQTPPSAYRPPTLTLSTATAAGAAAGSTSWPGQTMTVAPRSSIAAAEAAAAAGTADQDDAHDVTRIAEIGTWFVIVGAAMAVLGFLLPWSRVVIGSRALGGYLDTWGLASPTHVVVLLGALAILALGIMRTKVPVWLWAGVLALGLGGMLVGLAWPYQVGPLGADVGVIVVGLGGLALLIGGVVTSWATRHVEVEPTV